MIENQDELRRITELKNAIPAVRLQPIDEIPLERFRWLWPDTIPLGMVTLLAGAPGCGKTTIALSVAAVVSRGGTWPDGTACDEVGDVIVWSAEDPASIIRARSEAAGADSRRVKWIPGMTDSDEEFDPSLHIPLLEEDMRGYPNVRLLIIDPIVSAVSGDGNRSNNVRRALQPLVKLAERTGCAVLGITHFSKGTGGRDPVERITGSMAFGALARQVLVAAKESREDGAEPRHVMVRAKANHGAPQGGFAYALERVKVAADVDGQRVRWGEVLTGTAKALLSAAEGWSSDGSPPSALRDAVEFLQVELCDGPKPCQPLLRAAISAGHSKTTVDRAKAQLGIRSRKVGSIWEWSLPIKVAKDTKDTKDAKDTNRSGPDTFPSGLVIQAPPSIAAIDVEPASTIAKASLNIAIPGPRGGLGVVDILDQVDDQGELI